MKSNRSRVQKKIFFQKFTRKKYAVFSSLHKVIHISNLVTVYTLIVFPFRLLAQSDTVSPQKIVDLEEVEVVGQKNAIIQGELSHLLSVTAISEIDQAPSQSVTDLLRYTGNVDIRQRGKLGIQADVSIRGGSFDHSLIMLNGINISDPQTGHLSLNLPIETDAIQQIEILNGPGTRIYGSNAFSGILNFITAPSEINSLTVSSAAGAFGFYSTSATLNLPVAGTKNLLHYNNGFSSGYAKNTDFKKHSVFYQGVLALRNEQFDLQFGYSDRAFGANSFYTPRFPEQFEENQMYFIALGCESGEKIKVQPQIYWRRHLDRFELFREGDNWYRIEDSMTVSNNPDNTQFDTIPWYTRHNHHINDVFGVRLMMTKKMKYGTAILGWHLRSENIISTNIGYDRGIIVPVRRYKDQYYTLSDSRSNFDMNYTQTFGLYPFYLSGGLLINWNSYLPDELHVFPGIESRIYFVKNTYVYGSYNYSQGLPTFTDLTYEDPDNQGNNELKPYSQHSIAGGVRFINDRYDLTFTYFYQTGKDVIDWVWFEDMNKYSPINIDRYTGQGLEFTAVAHIDNIPLLKIFLDDVRLNYTWIDMNKEVPGNVLKYFNIRQKGSAMIQKEFFSSLIFAVDVSYIEREGYYLLYDYTTDEYETHGFQPYWLTDLRISYLWKGFDFYAEATNLFDTRYIDVGSIYQPGRWITGGIKYTITGF
jgi:iron complex outermembrane receptor protein